MNAESLESGSGIRICAHCTKRTSEALLKQAEYRCPQCGFEMAHVDTAPNGSIRGVFGYLKLVGDVIEDRYRIEKVLGKGGFGATYLVEDLRLTGKRRALKEVPELLFDEHEAVVLSRLVHPSIPDITDRFVSDNMIYLVLEFGGKRTLASQCQEYGGKIPLHAALPWMQQLCDALTYLHSQDPPVIHRDLKPENVLLDAHEHIMLIDFGIAKASDPAATTRMMGRAASHGFSPPEQVMGTGTDERSDIYSFGATFYYLLTGVIPPAAHERVAGTEFQPPSALVRDLPLEVDDFLLTTMNLNMNLRPRSIQELRVMIDALAAVVPQEQLHSSRTIRLGQETPGRVTTASGRSAMQGINITTAEPISARSASAVNKGRTNMVLVVVAAILLGTALAAGAYFFLSGKKTTESQVVKPPEPSPQTPLPPTFPQASLPPTDQGLQKPSGGIQPPAPPPAYPSGAPQTQQPPAQAAGVSAADILHERRSAEQAQAAGVEPDSAGGEAPPSRPATQKKHRTTVAPPFRKF